VRTLKRLGFQVGIVSGGFTQITDMLAADTVEAAGVPLSETVAIGDGANDLDMLAAAGLGVAFNAKPVVRAQADTAVNVPFLDTILFLLGIPGEEIQELTEQPGAPK